MNSPVEELKSEKTILLKNYLNEHKKHAQSLISSNQDGIFVFDLEGNIIQVNQAFEEILGYREEEAIQMKLQMLYPVESLDKVFHQFHKASLGQFQNFDCKMTHKYGEILHINITHIPLSVENQIVGIFAVARDITELKRRREQNEKMEEIHHSLTEHVVDLIISTNLFGKILYASPSCEQILGCKPSELVGEDYFAFIHPNDLKKAIKNRKEILVKMEKGRATFQFRKADGTFIWVESQCKPIIDPETQRILEVVSVIRDISERMQAEEELKLGKKAFSDLIENSPDGVVISKYDKIIYINETGVKLLGASSSKEILKKRLFDFVQPEYRKIAKQRLDRIASGEITEFFEYEIKRLDGSILTAEVKGIPTLFNNQDVHHIIIRDLSERKKTEEFLLNSEKLNIAGQLAAGIAHEVRNPLTAIKGFLQLLESGERNKNYFEIIQSEMDRIELILSELLVLAKPQDLRIEPESIVTLIDNVKALIDTQAILNNVVIETKYHCGDVSVNCDRNQIKQVFINFLKNAIEAMDKGGLITVEVSLHGTDKVKILFKDNGKGIPPHILKRIGEPFFSTKENGTGLGIMISKQIIENHNGTVHFWSDEQGTLIEVILPIS